MDGTEEAREERRGVRWQVPALVGGAVLLVGGLAAAFLTAPRPNVDRMLAQVEAMVGEGEGERALEALDGDLARVWRSSVWDSGDRARYHLLRARALWLAQQALQIESDANRRAVIAEYGRAEAAGAELEERDWYWLARCLVAVGEVEAGVQVAERRLGGSSERRGEIYRRAIERELAKARPDASLVERLIESLLRDPALGEEDQAWALARRAESMLRGGRFAEATAEALRGLIWLQQIGPEVRGELYVLLGEGEAAQGRGVEAEGHFRKALELAPRESLAHGRALVGLGEVLVERGEVEAGRSAFLRAVEGYPGTEVEVRGLVGMAEAEARLEHDGPALERFGQAWEMIRDGAWERALTRDDLTRRLLSWSERRVGEGRADDGLRYAQAAEGLYEGEQVPPAVLLAVAEASRASGEAIVSAAGEGAEALLALGAEESALVARRYRAAGTYYRMHAERVVLDDPEGYRRSLWYAAECFDRAGDRSDALGLFMEYAGNFPDDARRSEARFRAARLMQALGDYGQAAAQFRALIEESRDLEAGKNVGPWGPASYVPLAQCYLLDGTSDNDAEAEAVLLRVIGGELASPESRLYRDALIELGTMYYNAGRYGEAEARLREALERYPEDPEAPLVRFRLADTYRKRALSTRDRLGREAMPEDERKDLEGRVRAGLTEARTLYGGVIEALEARDAGRLDAVERSYLRNSYFYRADCAYELGLLDQAIHEYISARDRYAGEPASLVAMIQIVHAHLRQGRLEEARTANERARRFYRSFPPEVWDDPTLPLSRADWERWLDSMDRLTRVAGVDDQ